MPKIGVISDTHGLFRPELNTIFQDSSMLIHAGDIGNNETLTMLASIAPVTAVRGNVDNGIWAEDIPSTQLLQIEDISIFIIHDLKHMKPNPSLPKYDLVISGHSHQPLYQQLNDITHLNPGSAGPRRFKLPVTAALLFIECGQFQVEIITLG